MWREIRFNQVPIEDYFHIIDEMGRWVVKVACTSPEV